MGGVEKFRGSIIGGLQTQGKAVACYGGGGGR